MLMPGSRSRGEANKRRAEELLQRAWSVQEMEKGRFEW